MSLCCAHVRPEFRFGAEFRDTPFAALPEAEQDRRIARRATDLEPGSPRAARATAILYEWLTPIVKRIAERLCPRDPFAANLLATDTLAKLLFPIDKKGERSRPALLNYLPNFSFRAWCRAVMRNHQRDGYRDGWTRRARLWVEDRAAVAVEPVDLRLSPQDLLVIDAWPAADRVLLLLVYDLADLVPPQLWDAWCADRPDLPRVAPPELDVERDPNRRVGLLADALGVKRKTLARRSLRGRERLRRLPGLRRYWDDLQR